MLCAWEVKLQVLEHPHVNKFKIWTFLGDKKVQENRHTTVLDFQTQLHWLILCIDWFSITFTCSERYKDKDFYFSASPTDRRDSRWLFPFMWEFFFVVLIKSRELPHATWHHRFVLFPSKRGTAGLIMEIMAFFFYFHLLFSPICSAEVGGECV